MSNKNDILIEIKNDDITRFNSMVKKLLVDGFKAYGVPNSNLIDRLPNKQYGITLTHCIVAYCGKTLVTAQRYINTTTGCLITTKNISGILNECLGLTSVDSKPYFEFKNVGSYCQKNKYGFAYKMSNSNGLLNDKYGKLTCLPSNLSSEYTQLVIDFFNGEKLCEKVITLKGLCEFITTNYGFKFALSTKRQLFGTEPATQKVETKVGKVTTKPKVGKVATSPKVPNKK